MQGSDIGTLVYSVSASDVDDGANGEISFSLNDPSLPFDISPSGGAIIVAGPLDYETRNEYTVRIKRKFPRHFVQMLQSGVVCIHYIQS